MFEGCTGSGEGQVSLQILMQLPLLLTHPAFVIPFFLSSSSSNKSSCQGSHLSSPLLQRAHKKASPSLDMNVYI